MLMAHSQTEWENPRLAGLVQFLFVFSGPHRRCPCPEECELICHSRSTENPTVSTVLYRTRLFSSTGDTEFSPMEMACSRQCVEKGIDKDEYKVCAEMWWRQKK